VESVRNKYAEDVSIEHVDEFLGSFDVLQNPRTEAERRIVHLMRLGAVGPASAWLLVMGFFGWRAFRNRREVAALAGLVGTPYNSGDSARNQGISKAGNRRVRAMIVEIAWLWLRFQPRSALSQWYQTRFAGGGLHMRRIGIVALARKLLIALWRYLEDGVMPEGARLIASEI
jgi:transposase